MQAATQVKNVYLAEDDTDDAEIFVEAILELNDCVKVNVVDNGLKLLATMEQAENLPEMVFLDINMPGKTGFECLVEIKKVPAWQQIKIVMLSTSSHPAQINSAYDLGADLYMVKPVSFKSFKNRLHQCLQFDFESLKDSSIAGYNL